MFTIGACLALGTAHPPERRRPAWKTPPGSDYGETVDACGPEISGGGALAAYVRALLADAGFTTEPAAPAGTGDIEIRRKDDQEVVVSWRPDVHADADHGVAGDRHRHIRTTVHATVIDIVTRAGCRVLSDAADRQVRITGGPSPHGSGAPGHPPSARPAPEY
ncbi:hypothetical protein ACFOWE_31715 [Planomonospora corallina]|uniref:Lipoprotein n=1 Tax=Planomonospora corallina TaxID=1806052 RepID=A0ABV8IFV0_9ACTN